jgi:hypothetical protein
MSLITPKTPIQPIHVEQLNTNTETRLEIRSLACSWKTLSVEKLSLATTDLERKMYEAAKRVNLVASQRTFRISYFTHTFSLVVCYGLDLNIRGFAFVKSIMLPKKKSEALPPEHAQRFLHLNYLASDPKILFDKTEWKGIGASIVHFLFEKCIREKFSGIFVEPLPSAEPFFAHLKFSLSNSTGSTKRAMIWECPTT